MAAPYLAMGSPRWICETAATGASLSAAAGRLAFDSLLQRDGPDAARGRAFAQFETRFQVAWVVGALFGIVPLAWIRSASTPSVLV